MSKGNQLEGEILDLLLNGTPIANIADNAASSPLTDTYVALHTADPGEAGAQNTTEATYGSYARVAVARSGAGWTITGSSASPAADITFPTATSGSETLTHASVGTASSGTGKILYKGAISPTIVVTTGVQPALTTASTITED